MPQCDAETRSTIALGAASSACDGIVEPRFQKVALADWHDTDRERHQRPQKFKPVQATAEPVRVRFARTRWSMRTQCGREGMSHGTYSVPTQSASFVNSSFPVSHDVHLLFRLC